MVLGWKALDTACRQVKEWNENATPTRVSVNVSNRQFAQSDFADRVEQALTRAEIDGSAIQLEITESVMVQDYEMKWRRASPVWVLPSKQRFEPHNVLVRQIDNWL